MHDIWCDGDHDDDEGCNDPRRDCDPRCLGHWGNPDCNPCPYAPCTNHTSDGSHDEVCEKLHCHGHEWDPDNLILECFEHAAWCLEEQDDSGATDCFQGECTRRLDGGLILKTNLADGTSEIEFQGIWGPRTAQGAVDVAAGMQEGARLLAIEEAYLAQRAA